MVSAFALFPLLAALVSATVTTLDVAGLEANFANAKLTAFVPNADSPQGILEGGFLTSNIGAEVAQADTSNRPDLSVNALSTFNSTGAYTVMLVDANTVGTASEGKTQNLHWLTNGVTLGAAKDGSFPLTYDSANDIRAYAGPGPAAGSGAHRYMFLFYQQPADFAAPEGYNAKIESVDAFDLNSYATSAKLGNLVAANYMQVQNGQATFTVEMTMPVDSSTLSVAEPTSAGGSASANATETGSASGSASATGSASAGASAGASASGSQSAKGSASSGASASVAPPASATGSGAGSTLPALGLAFFAAAAAAFF